MDIASGESQTLLANEPVYEATWLADKPNTIITLRKVVSKENQTHVATYDIKSMTATRIIARFFARLRSLRVARLKNGDIAFAVDGPVGIDRYVDLGKHSIFYSVLKNAREGWELAGPLHNALVNTDLMPRNLYDLFHGGIVFIAEDIGVEHLPSRVWHTYLLRLDSFNRASTHGPRKIELPDESPDESRRNIHVYRLGERKTVKVLDTLTDGKWPLTPEAAQFAPSGKALYVTAEDHGRQNLYKIDLQPNAKPKLLFHGGDVQFFYPLGKDDEQILVTSSSLVSSSLYSIIYTDEIREPRVLSSLTNHGDQPGISSSQISEVHFKGAGDYQVHAWMVKPSYFDESRKYPLALFVHGGPESSWKDSWSLSNNFALFAEQGYIVVAPNITGSTGFGLEFEKAIRDNQGGCPYDDLVKCTDYLEHNPNIDINKAVMIGASYGGYMFKAMVSDRGVFNLPTYFMERDNFLSFDSTDRFSGSEILWKNPEGLERFNPARPDLLPNWKIPMLVVHGNDDFRCPVTGAIAAFRTLQLMGTPSRLLIFLHESHYEYKPQKNLKYLREVFSWINKYADRGEELLLDEHESAPSLRDRYLGPDWGQRDHWTD
ncbi:alpha/beta-hydrolase [Daldinia decipiens]|uniref:alpha/beta-hydrolase n=1 Tax=Daldinia decipiens TaxID=326647 RepID=UPI0020C4774E|nr:alpha/beta-hydrolase [Daldinia decipiens]KAI1656793.1 alpha/beta-hydrolase [Daldinia decipiens]